MRRSLLILAGAALTACAGVPADRGAAGVDALLTERGVPTVQATELAALTAEPLTTSAAVRIALLNSPRIARTYNRLGFAAADLYRAGRLGNPHLELAGPREEYTVGFALSFVELLTLPKRAELAREEFAAVQRDLGAEVLALIADVETAYYYAVGARQLATLHARAAEAATLSATLADRFREAGNMTPRDHALERSAAALARVRALEAERAAADARLELAALLGLPYDGEWTVPNALPAPPSPALDVDTLVERAAGTRLDLAAARIRTEVLAGRLGVTRWTRWTGDVEVGVEREKEAGGGRKTGATLAIEIPVFDWRGDRAMRDQAALERAVIELKSLALGVENEVRHAHAALTAAAAGVGEYRFELVPQRQAVVARTQEEVNFMVAGVFELLVAKRQEYEAWQGYLESVRDYWQARVALARAVGDSLPPPADAGSLDLDTLFGDPHAHHHHGGHE